MRQAFGPALAKLSADEREAAFAGAAGFARPLFESVGDERSAAGADAAYATLQGLYWLLFNLSRRGPLTLVVDDAQWADTPSLRFLNFLVARMDELCVALLVAWRTAEPGAEREELVTLSCRPDTVAVRPGPLSAEAVAQLVCDVLGNAPDAEFAAGCHEATAGNPFYIDRLLRELHGLAGGPGALGGVGS